MMGMSIQQYAALSSILFAARVDIDDIYDDAIHGIFNTSDTESTIPIIKEEVTKIKEEKMIKIIKNPDIHEFKCDCGCIFTYEAEDVGYADTGYFGSEFNFTIKCPYCNSTWALKYSLTDKEKEKIAKRLNISYKKEL